MGLTVGQGDSLWVKRDIGGRERRYIDEVRGHRRPRENYEGGLRRGSAFHFYQDFEIGISLKKIVYFLVF